MGVVADVQAYLEAQSLVDGTTGWKSSRRRLYDDEDEPRLVVLTEDGGPQAPIDAASGLGDAALKRPGVQVLVRGKPDDSDSAFAKAQAIYDALHSLKNTTLGTTRYVVVRARTPEPLFIGFDSKSRPSFTTSFLLTAAAV